MGNLRAVILLIWRIWARYDSRSIMRVTVRTWIAASACRVFFVSICFSDRRRCHDWVACFCVNRVPLLRVHSGAQHKQPSYND
jgi:uncharacterized RDD family membrane protein YckC